MRKLAIPAIAQSLLQTLVLVVDRAMLGHHGEASLAAMQIAGALEWSVWSVMSAFEVGTIARVGFHVGGRRPDRARRAARVSRWIAIVAGCLVALASPFVVAVLPRVAPDASPAAIDAAAGYLQWTLGATPFVFVAMTSFATLQAGGDTRTPLLVAASANVLHVAMNRVLILGAFGIPALGTRGAGISTAMTFAVEAAAATFVQLSRSRPASYLARRVHVPAAASVRIRMAARRRSLVLWGAEAQRLAHVAGPAVVERILYHAGYIGFVWIIWRLGDAAMAANQALLSVEAISYNSVDGFGVAAAAIVAQKLGASRPDQASRAAKIAAFDAVILLTSVGLAAWASRYFVLPIFSRDPDVVALGLAAVPILAVAQPFMAVSVVAAQALRGAGETKTVLGVSALGAFVVRLSCTWLFAITLGLGLRGVWIGSTLDWATRAALLAVLGARWSKGLQSASQSA